MISYFNKTETTFTNNGLGILDDYVIRPIVSEEMNGLFILEFDYPIHAPHSSKLIPEMLIRAPVPDLPDQLFRINERGDAIHGLCHIVGYHIFYDLAKNLIEDTFITIKNGSGALNQLLNSTQYSHHFTSSSNISTTNNARLVRLNPVEVLLDSELDNGFRARWGGEMTRDNSHIMMNKTRGSNRGVQIRDKKNLTGYKSNVNYSSVVTRIMPEGYDGLFLPEKYVDSPRINQYVAPKIRVIKYDSVKVGNKEGELSQIQAYAKLRELANQEYSINQIDLPVATYEVEFASLEKTEEYKDFATLETVNLGDTVSVIHEEDSLNIMARMLSYQYNPLLKAYISISLGNSIPKFTDIAKDIKRVDTQVKQAVDDADYALTAANGKNTNFYGVSTPVNARLGDVWYKENGDRLEMWIYETRGGLTQWFALMTDLAQEEVKRAVELAQAETAQALENATVAFNAANRAYLQVETLTTSVTRNTTQIQVFASGMTAFQNRVTTAETSLTVQAGQISSKASQTTVDTLTGRVVTAENTILQNATTFLAKISETDNKIGVPFKINQWEKGSLSSSDGSEVASNAVLRSGFLDVTYGEKYISQLVDGSTVAFYYHYYGLNVPYVDFVPNGKQYTETLAAGAYTNETIANYLLVKNVENLPITLTPTTNPYSNSGDYLAIYKLPLAGKVAPQLLTWTGKKDTSDNTVWLYTNRRWLQIATIISSAQTTYEWSLTNEQQNGVTGDSLYLAFFSIKTGSYAGIYNVSTTPFNLNPSSDHLLYQISTTNTSSAVTVPSGVVKMRVRVNTMDAPDVYQGNLYPLATRQDYTRTTSLYSAILMTKDLINLRVAKGDVINQINVSTEGILISGNKVHITGTTTIDSGVITSAMIATAAITNAKIGDATISSAKIASLDAAKITTGTLSAARIASNSITADKIATNILTTITASAAIRITGYSIGYYDNGKLVTQIDSQGITIRRNETLVGTIGANNISGHNEWRGLDFDLDYAAEYMTWAHKDTSNASTYTTKLTWYAKKLKNGMSKGFHFDDVVYFGDKVGVSYSDGTERHVKFTSTNISGQFETIQSGGGTAGIVFAGSNLYLCDDGIYVDFGIIREICKKLAGKSIALPTGFNSNGTATGWYNAQAFNNWTQYN